MPKPYFFSTEAASGEKHTFLNKNPSLKCIKSLLFWLSYIRFYFVLENELHRGKIFLAE